MPKFIKQYKWVFIISLLAYSFWVCYWLMLANIWFVGIEFFDIHFPSRLNPSPFTISHAASAVDSLVFFSTVTLVITAISFRKPEEEKLHTKIEYIFDGADAKSKLGEYLAYRVSSLACISPITDRVITFLEILPDSNMIKVATNTDVQIMNMHNNHQYATDEMMYRIQADDVEVPGGIFGEVHDISMVFDATNPEKNKRVIDCTEQLTADTRVFEERFSLKLQPQEKVIYKTNAWIWQSLKEDLRIVTPRYIEEQKITLKNKSDKCVTLVALLPTGKNSGEDFENKNISLKPNETITLELNGITPDDIITLRFNPAA